MTVHFEIEIQAPPARVWAATMDVQRWPEWTPTVTRVERLDEGPLRIGSRTRLLQPKLRPAIWQVTELDEPRGIFTWVAPQPGITVSAIHQIEPTPAGSRVTLSSQFRGFLAPILAPLLRKLTQEYLATEGRGLKKYCEGESKF